MFTNDAMSDIVSPGPDGVPDNTQPIDVDMDGTPEFRPSSPGIDTYGAGGATITFN